MGFFRVTLSDKGKADIVLGDSLLILALNGIVPARVSRLCL
jgi:hypothetical protein